MLNQQEYAKLQSSNERRMSHKAMLAALMISVYQQQPCFQQAYNMLYLLMDIDALIASWRRMLFIQSVFFITAFSFRFVSFIMIDKHVLLVQRQIGRKPGTGGTGGYSYLVRTIT
jgi:tryptophan 2,3-dioxygenase